MYVSVFSSLRRSATTGPHALRDDSAPCSVTVPCASQVLELLPNGTSRVCASGFTLARGVAADSAGNVFVTDEQANKASTGSLTHDACAGPFPPPLSVCLLSRMRACL